MTTGMNRKCCRVLFFIITWTVTEIHDVMELIIRLVGCDKSEAFLFKPQVANWTSILLNPARG